MMNPFFGMAWNVSICFILLSSYRILYKLVQLFFVVASIFRILKVVSENLNYWKRVNTNLSELETNSHLWNNFLPFYQLSLFSFDRNLDFQLKMRFIFSRRGGATQHNILIKVRTGQNYSEVRFSLSLTLKVLIQKHWFLPIFDLK